MSLFLSKLTKKQILAALLVAPISFSLCSAVLAKETKENTKQEKESAAKIKDSDSKIKEAASKSKESASKSKESAAKIKDLDQFVELEDTSKPLMHMSEDSKWSPAPDSLPPGAEMQVLEGSPAHPGPFTMRLKLPPNYTIPAHWHFSDEHITLIDGSLNLGISDSPEQNKAKTLSLGSYVRIPAKMNFFASTGDQGAIIQLHGVGPWGLSYADTMDEPAK